MVTLYKNIKDGWTLDEDHGKIRGLGIHTVMYTSPFPDIHTKAPIIFVTPGLPVYYYYRTVQE